MQSSEIVLNSNSDDVKFAERGKNRIVHGDLRDLNNRKKLNIVKNWVFLVITVRVCFCP